MILVDSSVWIDYFSGNDSAEANYLDRTLGNRAVAIGDLIVTEVLQGIRHEKDYKIAKSMLEELTVFEFLGKKMAIKSADNFRKLRKRGITALHHLVWVMPAMYAEQGQPPYTWEAPNQGMQERCKSRTILGKAFA